MEEGAQDGREPARTSLRPSAPPRSRDGGGPGKSWRILVALAWVALQLTLVFTAGRRADGAFGFRMFSESATISLALYREVATNDAHGSSRVHVDGGVWSARGSDGTIRRFSWYDRVPMPYWLFDREAAASYGAKTQLGRLQGALDDVASHIPDDAETKRLLLDVTVRRNGREPVLHHLTSRDRDGRGGS